MQIGYFDCDNSDDSNSEYSFHMNAYEEDDDIERGMELKATIAASESASASAAMETMGVASSTPSAAPSYVDDGSGGDGGEVPTEETYQQNSLHTLGSNKIDNKNTIQQLEFEHPGRRGGTHTMAKQERVECCHQCYGLEVEQHCLDFHQLYNSDFSSDADPRHH